MRGGILEYVALLLFIACLGIAGVALFYRGDAIRETANAKKARADRDAAKEELVEARRVTRLERERATRMQDLANTTEQRKKDAEAANNKLVADLRAGNVRLQDQWRGCQDGMPPSFPGTSVVDERNRLREESAGRIVRAVDECQLKVEGLQTVERRRMEDQSIERSTK